MKKTLTLISTGRGVVDGLVALVGEHDSELIVRNIIDDSVISDIRENHNIIPPTVVRRIGSYCLLAEEMGSDAALITCSSISETVDQVSPFVSIPLFKIDEPMAETAVDRAHRSIGIAATLMTTLRPTRSLIEWKAAQAKKELQFHQELCSGAFEALASGDGQTHDRIVLAGVETLLDQCDVVVLAQASMARAVANSERTLDEDRILTSPRLGIESVLNALQPHRSTSLT